MRFSTGLAVLGAAAVSASCAPGGRDELCVAVEAFTTEVGVEEVARNSWRRAGDPFVDDMYDIIGPERAEDYRALMDERLAAREEDYYEALVAAMCEAARDDATAAQVRVAVERFEVGSNAGVSDEDANAFFVVTMGFSEWQEEAGHVYGDYLRETIDEVNAEARRRGIIE
ncbi:MAG: hypothetical protein PVI23_12235 [Maricaulaceae bacterium]|jgi:hypothetical protein